jgi:putative phage-type endonuclease
MGFRVIDCPQRSPEWFAARAGLLTASRAADFLATYKDGKTPAASRKNLLIQLALERITGKPQESGYVNAAMQQGIEREAGAVALYDALTGRCAMPSGFLAHDTYLAGCSLDGHVDDFTGIVEVKSPQPATHWEYVRTGIVPPDYVKQITHQLWITGARWCDWLSYNPDFPEPLQVKLVRIERDEKTIADYQAKALAFLAEVERECEVMRTLAGVGAVLRAAVA